jgi:hypothetical protein
LLFYCTVPLALHAQTAAQIDAILDSPGVSREDAARFVLLAAGILSPEEAGRAFRIAQENNWLQGAENTPIKLGELSFLVMKSFGLKGSFLYKIAPGPRYGFRELQYRRLIPSNADPSRPVPGKLLLQILGNVLSATGEGE